MTDCPRSLPHCDCAPNQCLFAAPPAIEHPRAILVWVGVGALCWIAAVVLLVILL